MDRRQIKQLVEASITKDKLDEQKVEKIAGLLTRKELKEYSRALRNWLKSNTIVVEVAQESDGVKKEIADLYPNKTIVIKENPSLLLGMRIYDNDDIYEVSLKNTLDKMTDYVSAL